MLHKLGLFLLGQVAVDKLTNIVDDEPLVLLHLFKPDDEEVGVIFVRPAALDVVPVGAVDYQTFLVKSDKLLEISLHIYHSRTKKIISCILAISPLDGVGETASHYREKAYNFTSAI